MSTTMNLRFYEREAVTVAPGISVVEIADLMDEESVGSVVVVDEAGKPLGIVTDRDLALRVVAAGRDAEKTCARDVMSEKLVTVGRREPLPSVLEKAAKHAVRRLPVVEEGRVVSLISLDDSLFELAVGVLGCADCARVELRESARTARKRRRREAREQAIEELRSQIRTLGRDARERLRKELGRVAAGPTSDD